MFATYNSRQYLAIVVRPKGASNLSADKSELDWSSGAMPLLQVAGSRHNLLVTAATGQMMVYNAERLVWAAKGDTCPVAVKVATFAGLPGRSISPHYHVHHIIHLGQPAHS